MASLGKQIGVVTALNIRSIPQRGAMSLASVVAVALTVSVLLFFLALASGLSQTMKGSGSDGVAIVLRDGAGAEINSVVTREQIDVIGAAPGVVHHGQEPVISGELLVIVDGIKRDSGTKANMPFRGIGPQGLALRHGVHIVQGRMFRPGTNEIVVGAGLLHEFSGFEYGREISIRGTRWKVVGVFEAPGTVFDSELWADIAVTQSLFNRPNVYQTLRVQLTGPAAMAGFVNYVKNEPRLQLEAMSERAFYAQQAQGNSGLVVIGMVLGVFMAIGALAGALNTMYSSVASRATEIATLRIIGFSGYAAFFGTMVEALALSLAGGVVGIIVSYIVFNGRTTSTLSSGFTQLVFHFAFTPGLVIAVLIMAMIIGFLGGILPGVRAARMRPNLELAGQ